MRDDRYFEDFEVGQRFVSRGASLSEAQILDFAFQYDPQPFHIDKEAAKTWGYGGLIASGFQTLCVGFRMIAQEGIFIACSLGSPGMDKMRWLAPVRPGDTIHTELEVLSLRESQSKPDRGIANFLYEIVKQDGTKVMSFEATQILSKRPKD